MMNKPFVTITIDGTMLMPKQSATLEARYQFDMVSMMSLLADERFRDMDFEEIERMVIVSQRLDTRILGIIPYSQIEYITFDELMEIDLPAQSEFSCA